MNFAFVSVWETKRIVDPRVVHCSVMYLKLYSSDHDTFLKLDHQDIILVYHLSVAVAKDTQSEGKALDHIVIDVEDNSKSLFVVS